MPEIKKFFDDFIIIVQNLMNNEISEFDFLIQSNELLVNLVQFMQEQDNNFKTQVNFFQNKYYINFLFFISFMERISTFEKNTEIENSEPRKNIDDLVKQIFENIHQVLNILVKDNPMTASLLFSRIAISLLIRNDFNELGFYRNILKMMQRFNCKINTYFLTSHVHNIFKERMIISPENNDNIIMLLKLYKIILKISSDNSMLKVNNIIASDLRFIIKSQEFPELFNSMKTDTEINIVEGVYQCIHLLQNEYFYIINQFINILTIIDKLKDENLKPKTRKVLTKIHTDYFVKNYFSTITIQKYFQNENLITSNLVENLTNSDEQKALHDYLIANDMKSQISELEDDKMSKILQVIFFNLEYFRFFDVKYSSFFANNFKVAVSFFKNLVLLPTAYSVYKLTYFPKSLTPSQRYDLYKLIFLYHYCFQYFVETMMPKYDLSSKENEEVFSKLFVEGTNIDEIKENLKNSISVLGIKTEKNLDIKFLFKHFVKNSKCFIIMKENFFKQEEEKEEKEEEHNNNEEKDFSPTFYNLSLDMNLFKRIKRQLDIYKEQKSVFEGNNVFDDIFQDENIEQVQKKIAIDLLYKLFFKKYKSVFNKQEKIGYSFQREIVKGLTSNELKHIKNPFSNIYSGRRGARASFDPNFNDKTEKYGEFYNPYLSPFLEEKSLLFEIVDKCFKSNPNMWQEIFVSMGINGRDLIYNIIMKQLPFLLQFIFIEFNKIDKKETPFYQYFVNVLEFLRLLCEDHNPLFQTMFINYERSIGKVSLLVNDKNLFMP